MEALINADNRAALSMSEIKIVPAKAQAWDIFQSTWTRSFDEILDLVAKPSPFSTKIHHGLEELVEPLQKLHEKHRELVTAVVTPTSRQLAPGLVTTARVLADSQAATNEIATKIKELKALMDERQKRFEDTSLPVTDEP
jgi:hypothetical protein